MKQPKKIPKPLTTLPKSSIQALVFFKVVLPDEVSCFLYNSPFASS